MKKSGFTLIELIVVILVMAIMARIAVARWPGNNITLNAQAQQLGSQIRRTQALSMSQGQRFRLNLSSGSYSITNSAGTTYFTDTIRGQNTLTFPSGITASWSTAILSSNLISFDGNGTPYTNATATVALASTAVITLTSAGYSRTVSISPGTGRVIVQ
jgi:prepilin-type N-terminal cleavage/methylation domain-containing protein